MTPVILALLAACCYGTADLCGGMATRASSVVRVLFTSHGASLVLLLVVLAVLPAPHPTGLDWRLSTGGGVAALVGLLCLYRGLAGGHMAVVSAVSALLSAVVPMLSGVVLGERPSAVGWTGVALGLVATVLVSSGGHASTNARDPLGRTVALAVGAGLGIGTMMALNAHCTPGAGLVPVGVMRTMSVVVFGAVLAAGHLIRPRESDGAAPARGLLPSRPVLAALAGTLDVVGTVTFMQASHAGQVTLAAVLAAQYPLVTTTLARLVLGERLTRIQHLGLVATLVAVGLLAAG